MNNDENLNHFLDQIIYQHKKQLDDIKKSKYENNNNSKNFIKEIENYNPERRVLKKQILNDMNDNLNLNYQYKSDSSERLEKDNCNEEIRKRYIGKIKHKNEKNFRSKSNFSDIVNLPVEDDRSELINRLQILNENKEVLIASHNKLNENIEFLKKKIEKKKSKIINYRDKAFYLEDKLHNEEKKNIDLEEKLVYNQNICQNQSQNIEILKDDLSKLTQIIDYLFYFLNKIQNLYPSFFKKKALRSKLVDNDISLEVVRERLIELENFILLGVLSSNKLGIDNSEERISLLNKRIFDMEEENKKLHDQLKCLINEKQIDEGKEGENKKEEELQKMKEFENRLLELENQLTTKVAENNVKEDYEKKFKENLLTKNNMITGSSEDPINILNSLATNQEIKITNDKKKEEKKEKKKENTNTLKKDKKSNNDNPKRPIKIKSIK